MSTKVYICGMLHGPAKDQKWQIPSSSQQAISYTVTYNAVNNDFKCTCIGYKTHKGKHCKHIMGIINRHFTGKSSQLMSCTYNSFIHGDGPNRGVCPFCQGHCYIVELDI